MSIVGYRLAGLCFQPEVSRSIEYSGTSHFLLNLFKGGDVLRRDTLLGGVFIRTKQNNALNLICLATTS
jgi:hypothetical protein